MITVSNHPRYTKMIIGIRQVRQYKLEKTDEKYKNAYAKIKKSNSANNFNNYASIGWKWEQFIEYLNS